ncbi:hypothetical protein C8F01DRAFT_1261817 [Mycena amicta]|nr:hypothetical protein C8F01DRAFT_1261817 [Mycena amicta]
MPECATPTQWTFARLSLCLTWFDESSFQAFDVRVCFASIRQPPNHAEHLRRMHEARVRISTRVHRVFVRHPRPIAGFASPIRTHVVLPFTIAHKLSACVPRTPRTQHSIPSVYYGPQTTERRCHVIASTDMRWRHLAAPSNIDRPPVPIRTSSAVFLACAAVSHWHSVNPCYSALRNTSAGSVSRSLDIHPAPYLPSAAATLDLGDIFALPAWI